MLLLISFEPAFSAVFEWAWLWGVAAIFLRMYVVLFLEDWLYLDDLFEDKFIEFMFALLLPSSSESLLIILRFSQGTRSVLLLVALLLGDTT